MIECWLLNVVNKVLSYFLDRIYESVLQWVQAVYSFLLHVELWMHVEGLLSTYESNKVMYMYLTDVNDPIHTIEL